MTKKKRISGSRVSGRSHLEDIDIDIKIIGRRETDFEDTLGVIRFEPFDR